MFEQRKRASGIDSVLVFALQNKTLNYLVATNKMTIITKPLSEKKAEKLVPLVENDSADVLASKEDVEAAPALDRPRLVILRTRVRRVSTSTTLCLLMTALMVVGIGIVGGTYLYRQYLRAQMHRFRGWYNIPYDAKTMEQQSSNDASAMPLWSETKRIFNDINSMNHDLMETFPEEFDLDLDNEKYEKIEVPDFRDGRNGRFVHDFNTNLTGIIDVTGRRCFIMPLNRHNVLPPRSLFDLVHKMWDGVYSVDTEEVRETMRVVLPPLSDTKQLGSYISGECRGLPVYQLEKYVGGVVKREAKLEPESKFAIFSGKGIMLYDIVNMDTVKQYEDNLVQH